MKGLEVFDDVSPIGTLCDLSDLDKHKKVITTNLTIIPIELPKMNKYRNITIRLMRWLKFFK